MNRTAEVLLICSAEIVCTVGELGEVCSTEPAIFQVRQHHDAHALW